jgi:uncharacterized protein (TIGR02246 family)
MNQDIVNVMRAYEKSLNTSDTQAALALYGDDPVFMPQFSTALSGRDAVKAGYDHVFGAIKLNVSFTIHEIVEMGDLAYVRTTSAGKTELLNSKTTVQEANNELFIFRKEKGNWKIHRYLFASCNPPGAK